MWADAAPTERGGELGRGPAQKIAGDAEVDGAARRREGRVGGGHDGISDLGSGVDQRHGLGHRCEHRGLVAGFVQAAAVGVGTADGGGDVGGDDQHGRARGHRLPGGAQGVRRARAGGDDGHAQPTGGAGVPLAAYTAACSWRTPTSRIDDSDSAFQIARLWTPGSPKATDAPRRSSACTMRTAAVVGSAPPAGGVWAGDVPAGDVPAEAAWMCGSALDNVVLRTQQAR